jgi:hypothetical protein
MPTLDEVEPGALLTLLKGEPGVRKSTCALSYPMPQYWISTDKKMGALSLPAKKWNIDKRLIDFDDYNNWDAPRQKLELLETNCRYKTIIVDSITSIGDNMNRQVQKVKGKDNYHIGNIPVSTIEDYKAEASAFVELMALLNSIRKFHKVHVIIIAHVVGQRSDNANKLTHHSRVIVTGGDKISAKISAYADEAYHFNIRPAAAESEAGEYTCLTTHTGADYARTTLDLPPEIVFNDKRLFDGWIKPAIERMKVKPTVPVTPTQKPTSIQTEFT